MAKDIILAGDSLIEYYDWQGRFPSHRVTNLGISGETVEGLLRRTGRIITGHPPSDLVFLMSGINNLAMEDSGFTGAYRQVVEGFSSAWPGARIYVNSLLPTLLPWIPPGDITTINLSLKKLAAGTGALYLDVHALFLKAGVKECLLEDGVHVSETGYTVWSGAIERILQGA
jgi:lysophospholipase L1-like esterase